MYEVYVKAMHLICLLLSLKVGIRCINSYLTGRNCNTECMEVRMYVCMYVCTHIMCNIIHTITTLQLCMHCMCLCT